MENGDEERLKLQLRILREVLELRVKFFPSFQLILVHV